MARIEWVKNELNNWALWKVTKDNGGMGFAKQSILCSEASDTRYAGNIIPVLELDAERTDQAVESLKVPRPRLYDTLQAVYISGLGIKGAAKRLARAPSTISACLEAADRAISAWHGEKAEQDRLKKRSFTG